jgi:2-keto-4-pentenoate hydratase/2-oxohepta-3-ene-1,7-dioic acid hydratase in catechol pathway
MPLYLLTIAKTSQIRGIRRHCLRSAVVHRRARAELPGGRVLAGTCEGDLFISDGEQLPLDGLRLLAPVEPTKLICVGLNYRDHAAETGATPPEEPLLFFKPPSALLAPGAPIIRPPAVERLDYEGELAVVIARRCRNVRAEDALGVVAGLSVANDVTARDYQLPDSQWTRAKGYDTFAPVGPWLTETTEWRDLTLTTTVNGAVRQSSSTSQLIFGVPEIIAYASSIMTLEAGDLIFTGTPAGIGPLDDGDTVEVTIETLGTLRNTVAGTQGPQS